MYTMEDLDNIPFSIVGQNAWNDLANKLDPESSITGNNWRILAEKLGFTMENILNIDARQSKHGRNTLKLFEDYIKLNGNSVGAVYKALVDMDRVDAVEALDSHIPEIREKYRVSRNNIERSRMPVQNACYDSSTRCSSLGYHQRPPPPAHCNPVHYHHPFSTKDPYNPARSVAYNDLSRNGDTCISRSSNQSKDYNLTSTSYSNSTLTNAYSSRNHDSPTNGFPSRNPSEAFTGLRVPENLSKIVHIDPSERYTSEEMDVSDEGHGPEEGQPLAAAIQREEHYRNIGKRPLPDRMEADESESPTLKRPDLRFNIPNADNMFMDHSIISPSPSPAAENSLAQLNYFAKSNTFMPGTVYNRMIKEKNKQEYEQGRRAQNKEPVFKVPEPAGQNGRIQDFHIRRNDEMVRTFPLRTREFPSLPSKERPALLKTSVSVPNDMKPAEYRKAFKHIKVFVTYAGDSKRHIQKVLNLCRCLEKNGFTCCMDMFDKRMQDMDDRQDWCAQRFTEADFILMCVSHQYKTEVDMYECAHVIDDKELHIQYIYSLMLAEIEHNGRKESRVIPVLFEGSETEMIPNWLQDKYFYRWPAQYRDLLWCLTKPHTRIKLCPQYNHSLPTSNGENRNISL